MSAPVFNPVSGIYLAPLAVSIGWTPQSSNPVGEDPDLLYKMDGAALALTTREDGDAAITELRDRMLGADPNDAPTGTWKDLYDDPCNWRDHIKVRDQFDTDPANDAPLVRHPGHKAFESGIWWDRKADYDVCTVSGGRGKPRADMNVPKVGGVRILMKAGLEYWAGQSIYIMSDWEWDEGPSQQRTQVVELHSKSQNTGSLRFLNGKWQMHRKIVASISDGTKVDEYFITTPAVRGVWADFVWNVKVSKGSDGFVKLWKDGEFFASTPGFNYTNADDTDPDQGIPFTHGKTYKGGWYVNDTTTTQSPKRLVHAEFRIIQTSDAAKGLAAVDPSINRA